MERRDKQLAIESRAQTKEFGRGPAPPRSKSKDVRIVIDRRKSRAIPIRERARIQAPGRHNVDDRAIRKVPFVSQVDALEVEARRLTRAERRVGIREIASRLVRRDNRPTSIVSCGPRSTTARACPSQ